MSQESEKNVRQSLPTRKENKNFSDLNVVNLELESSLKGIETSLKNLETKFSESNILFHYGLPILSAKSIH
ncbi:hypothetical protein D915_002480 [Fasciola hepatica]|uniref:Uncharacterized protein n=1 Tax=Fasciola hepatica TaxID=6192 RepID=A0A4E0RHL9_FASHE|nr:hypothetical protein D915_002480 [Fasciola hepatica]